MITLLDCINRVPLITDSIIEKRGATFKPLIDKWNDELKTINQIILVGSGTSNTSAVTARGFIEKVTKLQTICILPNEFLYNTYVYNPNALYVFTSQSGTSSLTNEAVRKMKELGYKTISITESDETPLAKAADLHINMGCGKEEYGMRTIGYCASILTLMLLGLEIAKHINSVSEEEYTKYIHHASLISTNHKNICDKTLAWFDHNKEQLLYSKSFTIYGNRSLYGVALEGALKILEISKHKLAIGYEMDDGMHGPTMGYSSDNCVIALCDGERDDDKYIPLIKWAKNEMHNGFIFGYNTLDETDLEFETKSEEFRAIEFAPTVEILAYRLAVDVGIDLTDRSRHKEKEYFNTHKAN